MTQCHARACVDDFRQRFTGNIELTSRFRNRKPERLEP